MDSVTSKQIKIRVKADVHANMLFTRIFSLKLGLFKCWEKVINILWIWLICLKGTNPTG